MKTTADLIAENGWSMIQRLPLATITEICWATKSSDADDLLPVIGTELWREALAFGGERE